MLQFIIQLHQVIRFARFDIASAALVDRSTSSHNVHSVRRFFSDPAFWGGRSQGWAAMNEEAIRSFEIVAKPVEKIRLLISETAFKALSIQFQNLFKAVF